MIRFKTLLFLLTLLFFTTAPGFTAQHSLGVGAGVTPDYEGSENLQMIPMLSLSGRYDSGRFFTLTGTKLKVNLLSKRRYSFGPALRYHMGRSGVDNSQVDAMKDIDGTIEAGIIASHNISSWTLGFEFLSDVSDKHSGTKAQVSIGYRWKATDHMSISPGLSVTYADEDYMETFFGINSNNRGASTLPDYSASSGIKDIGAKVLAHYTPWKQWGVMGIMSCTMLLNDAKNSPIVEAEGEANQVFLGLMATYRWGQ